MPYLDNAGAALPSKRQLDELSKFRNDMILANPHSRHSTALKTKQLMNSARLRVLQYFNASSDDYFVVFTYNTTHSLKIVAENFKFTRTKTEEVSEISNILYENQSQFAYLYDSHHSVIGLRNFVKNRVDSISCVSENAFENIPNTSNSLFVLTAMSNFCGKKYDLDNIAKLQEKGWSVCLDAASLVSTAPLDLKKYRPNFVALSFYKMFGYPTGVGALIIRKNSEQMIPKNSFAGGTVQSVEEDSFYFISKDLEDAYEEGTMNFHGIAAIQHGFDEIERCGGIKNIQNKTYSIAKQMFKMLSTKVHENGKQVVEIYSQNSSEFGTQDEQGAIITFNIKRPDGGYYGYNEVEKICAIFGIEIRTGCFCNIGACRKYLGISHEMIQNNQRQGKRCGDEMDLIDGKPTGAVRISFGRQSEEDDILVVENMIDNCFVGSMAQFSQVSTSLKIHNYSPEVVRLCAFPIKSCASETKDSFNLTERGFEYDRDFMIVQSGITLSLKTHPELCRISATISEDKSMLEIKAFGEMLEYPLKYSNNSEQERFVCRNKISTISCDEKTNKWLDNVLDMQNCQLVRVTNDSFKSFVNESPFLLINEASVHILSQIINIPTSEIITRFRSNIVVRGMPPFIEDTAKHLSIEGINFEVVDKCLRCEMICIDPDTGVKDPSLILALRNFRKNQKLTFGIYIRQTSFQQGTSINIGDMVQFN
ncbi:unnamed protein product [Caenorhabditis angaria]|uniref:Molybdenum cofactor sulfurase n=1 Tax=Caenorhabditis angaria TaxID=860376 RepID=A0A9P1N8E7_9PELO|nr:unnamed protein product [Caenorhabditis angaria]